ncbi:MAG: hypothetical protein BWY31_02461 [Lentisphaerae bacterium ADurb.Bin242]|nr:MAG: hypothetical protein BWY31_02461 [Lentisphaerae bacterium ADurb.Bin242]
MRKRIFAAACAILLPVCASGDDEKIRILTEIRNQLDEANRKLDRINDKISVLSSRSVGFSPAQPAVLPPLPVKEFDKITLSENPVPEEVAEYIKKIGQVPWTIRADPRKDPQVEKYAKIGPGYLGVILPLLKSPEYARHLKYALPRLVGKSDKEFVLRNLSRYPELAPSVMIHGWFPEAKNQLIAILKNTRDFSEFQEAIPVMAATPETRAALVEVFRFNPYADYLFMRIESFPDVDHEKLAREVWEKMSSTRRTLLMLFAARNGVKEALSELVSRAAATPEYVSAAGNRNVSLSQFVNQLLGQKTNIRETAAWYSRNSDWLVFDKQKRQYVLSVAEH